MTSAATLEPAEQAARAAAGSPGRRASGHYRLAALWALYVLTLRQHLHGKRWIATAVLFLLPAGVAAFGRAAGPQLPRERLGVTLWVLVIPPAAASPVAPILRAR